MPPCANFPTASTSWPITARQPAPSSMDARSHVRSCAKATRYRSARRRSPSVPRTRNVLLAQELFQPLYAQPIVIDRRTVVPLQGWSIGARLAHKLPHLTRHFGINADGLLAYVGR